MTVTETTNTRTISEDELKQFELEIAETPIISVLLEYYPVFICGNSFREFKNQEGRSFTSLEEVFKFIITHTIEIGKNDAYIYLLMAQSQIGKLSKKGYAWQKLPEEEKWRLISLQRLLYNNKLKKDLAEKLSTNDGLTNIPIQKDHNKPMDKFNPLKSPYILAEVDKEFSLRIVGEQRNRLIIFLSCISNYVENKPLGAVGEGGSSVGKSMVYNTVLSHFPEKMPDMRSEMKTGWFLCNNITEAALFRLKDSFVDHTIFYLGEIPDDMTDTEQELYRYLRQLQSEGLIQKTLAEQTKSKNDIKEWDVSTKRVVGNISFFACSILGFEQQFENRNIKLSFDESEAQTKRIVKWKSEIEKYAHLDPNIAIRKTKSEFIINLVKNIDTYYYKQFEKITFSNPYSDIVSNILQKLYGANVQLRRASEYVFRFIESITRLHLQNREITDVNYINGNLVVEASPQDNIIALYLLWDSLENAIKNIRVLDLEILELIKDAIKHNPDLELYPNEEDEYGAWWSINKMAKAITKGKANVIEACKRLTDVGYLINKPTGKKGTWVKYQVVEQPRKLVSISPTDFLPFFLPRGVRSMFDSQVVSNQGGIYDLKYNFDNAVLASILGNSYFYIADEIICSTLSYQTIVLKKYIFPNHEMEDTLENKYFVNVLQNIFCYAIPPKIETTLNLRQQVLWRWALEVESSSRPVKTSFESTSPQSLIFYSYNSTQKATEEQLYTQLDEFILKESLKLKKGDIGIDKGMVFTYIRQYYNEDIDSKLIYEVLGTLEYNGKIISPKEPYIKHTDAM